MIFRPVLSTGLLSLKRVIYSIQSAENLSLKLTSNTFALESD
jgi:hypothetical protein